MVEDVRVIRSPQRQATLFIGREQEIGDIIKILDDPTCRLLTLVGPGGIGKTRLALEVARWTLYRDGIYFVALHALRSADYIPSAIMHALGLPSNDKQHLLSYLSDRQSLLILDNFEHLLEGAGLIAEILDTAPYVKLVVTSREALNLHEEWLWPVKGLHFPESENCDDLKMYSAVQLFAERARKIYPAFSLDDDRVSIVRICQLVEGIPLAIELAANWIKTLSSEAIAAEIQKDINFLTSREHDIPERHRSMRAVYNHSWRLMFEEERKIFQKLTVFHGGFTREAAEQVAGASLPILAALVDKSLVWQIPGERYAMHELLRQFGAEQLAESGDYDGTIECYVKYFADFMSQCELGIKYAHQLKALNKIEADFENVRAALSHAVSRCIYDAIDRMIDSLHWFGLMRSRFVETSALFEGTRIALVAALGESPPSLWGRVLVHAPRHDIAPIEEALAIARQSGQDKDVAFCLAERGSYHSYHRNFAHAFSDQQGSLEIYQRLGDRFGMCVGAAGLAYYAITSGDWNMLRATIDLGMHLADEIGSDFHQFRFRFIKGWAACFDGQYDESERQLQEAVTIANRMGFLTLAADSIGSLAYLSFLRGHFRQAKAWVTDDLKTVTQVKSVGEQGFAKIVLAHIACVEADYRAAKQLAQEALLLVTPHPIRERFIARVLALVSCGLGDYDQARQYVRTALLQESRPGTRAWILPACALILSHEGKLQQAAEMLSLSFNHPASATGWLEQWALMTQLREQLQRELGESVYAAAWERGLNLDLDEVVEQLLVETDEQVRQPLAEPLTDRELEVLRLIAEGLSNHEIAVTLTVVEGTVRTHVYNLCQKLSASNRTQAVARARSLRILQ